MPPRDLAESLRRTVMAIAREWGVDPQDLTDPSDDALARLERDIEKAKKKEEKPKAVKVLNPDFPSVFRSAPPEESDKA